MTAKAVVVGGLGFLGAAVVRELIGRGDAVVVLDRAASQAGADRRFGTGAVQAQCADMLDRPALLRHFRGADEIYHFGGRLGTSELNDDMFGAIDANITGAVSVFDAAVRSDVGRVFFPSKPNVWLNSYTITKVASEDFARLYNERGDVAIACLRYFNAYGPEQATGPVQKLIPTFALQATRGEPLGIFGDGEQTVDMVFAPDLARITVDVMRSGWCGTPMDCGRGVALTVNQVAAAVNAHFGRNGAIRHLPMREGEVPRTRLVADVAPLRAVVGDLRFTDWMPSLATTLEWYRAQCG